MINPDGIVKDEYTGKWNVYFGGEWLFTCNTYEQADDLLRDCYCTVEDDYYGDDGGDEREAYGIIGDADPWDDFERDYNDDHLLIE